MDRKERIDNLIDEYVESRIDRTDFLKRAGLLGLSLSSALALAGTAQAHRTPASSQAPPKFSLAAAAAPYKGTTLNILDEVTDLQPAMKKLMPQFEKETGIKVSYELIGHLDVIRKGELDLFSGRGTYDAVMIHSVQLGRVLEGNAILLIDEFLRNPKLRDPGVKFSDFLQPLTDQATVFGGKRIAFPAWNYNQIYWARRDLLEHPDERKAFRAKFGYPLGMPKTLQQVRDIGEFFTRKKGEKLARKPLKQDFFGFVMEGARLGAAFYNVYYDFMRQFGGELFDTQGQPKLDTPQNARALKFYADLWKFAPPGQAEFSLVDIPVVMGQGKAAAGFVWSDFLFSIDTPGGSKFAGKFAYSGIPANAASPRTHVAATEPSFLVINKESKNPEATFLLLQWMASKKTQSQWFGLGRAVPVRKDAFDLPKVKSGSRAGLYAAMRQSLQVGQRWPVSAKLPEIADALNLHQQKVGLGKETPEQAVKELQSQISGICKSCLLKG